MTVKARPVLDRFVEKIAPESAEDCWPWLGSMFSKTGYGAFYLAGRMTVAHRVSYELFVGAIPTGLHLDHLCRNRPCVNPSHLEAVTLGENNRRAGAAVQVCRHGHDYTPENTYRDPNGRRRCRQCARANRRKFIVSQFDDPATVPVLINLSDSCYLTPEGRYRLAVGAS